MLRPVILIFFILSILIIPATAQYRSFSAISIIPKPQHLQEQEGHFILNATTRIYVNPEQLYLEFTAQQLAQEIKKLTGQQPQVLFKKPEKKSR